MGPFLPSVPSKGPKGPAVPSFSAGFPNERTTRDGTSPVRPSLDSEGNAHARPNESVRACGASDAARGDPKAARDPRRRERNAAALHSLPSLHTHVASAK